MSDWQYVAVKMTVAFLISLVPITAIYVIEYFTADEGTAKAWALSALIVLVGSKDLALYGLAAGLAFSCEAAVSAASGLLVMLASLGKLILCLTRARLT